MAILTRAEFAATCNRTVLVINTNISRNKISTIPPDNKMIDSENPLNKIFKKNCLALDKKKAEEEKLKKKEQKLDNKPVENPEELEKAYTETVQIFTKQETPAQEKRRKKQNEEDAESVNWDARKKKADALKAERAAELAQLQVEKMMGNLMPVDLVEMILKVNIQDIFKTFENELINLGSIYCDILAGGNRDKLSELITKLRLKLNETIKRIESTAAQEIENTVEDYAEVRSRGERK